MVGMSLFRQLNNNLLQLEARWISNNSWLINAMIMKYSDFVVSRLSQQWQHQKAQTVQQMCNLFPFHWKSSREDTHSTLPHCPPWCLHWPLCCRAERSVLRPGWMSTPQLWSAHRFSLCKGLTRQIFIFSCELISCLCHTDAAESVSPAAATHNSD